MPAVDLLRRKREVGYDDSRDQATTPRERALPITDLEKRDFAGMGYQVGQPITCTVQGTWDGEKVLVESVQCNPPQGAVEQGPPPPPAEPIMRMNPAPVPG